MNKDMKTEKLEHILVKPVQPVSEVEGIERRKKKLEEDIAKHHKEKRKEEQQKGKNNDLMV
jgi:hypothetical protein